MAAENQDEYWVYTINYWKTVAQTNINNQAGHIWKDMGEEITRASTESPQSEKGREFLAYVRVILNISSDASRESIPRDIETLKRAWPLAPIRHASYLWKKHLKPDSPKLDDPMSEKLFGAINPIQTIGNHSLLPTQTTAITTHQDRIKKWLNVKTLPASPTELKDTFNAEKQAADKKASKVSSYVDLISQARTMHRLVHPSFELAALTQKIQETYTNAQENNPAFATRMAIKIQSKNSFKYQAAKFLSTFGPIGKLFPKLGSYAKSIETQAQSAFEKKFSIPKMPEAKADIPPSITGNSSTKNMLTETTTKNRATRTHKKSPQTELPHSPNKTSPVSQENISPQSKETDRSNSNPVMRNQH